MTTVLLIAATTGYQTRSFGEAAEKLGWHMVLATDRCHRLEDPWGDHAIPIRFEAPLEAVTQSHQRIGRFARLGNEDTSVVSEDRGLTIEEVGGQLDSDGNLCEFLKDAADGHAAVV